MKIFIGNGIRLRISYVLIGIFSLSIVLGIVILEKPSISEKIQAILVFVLVTATIYYSRQTRILVEKQDKALSNEKRRNLFVYSEKRIDVYIEPLIDLLRQIILNTIKIDYKQEQHLIDISTAGALDLDLQLKFYKLLRSKAHMASAKVLYSTNKIGEHQDKFGNLPLEKIDDWKNNYIEILNSARDDLLLELNSIQFKLRKIYGVDTTLDELDSNEEETFVL